MKFLKREGGPTGHTCHRLTHTDNIQVAFRVTKTMRIYQCLEGAQHNAEWDGQQ